MQLRYGQLVKNNHQTYFSIGSVVVNNPQLILDNVNYIGKKNFVIHIKFGAGITRHAILLIPFTQRQLPTYLTQTDLAAYQKLSESGDWLLLNPDADELNRFQLVEELEIEAPADEQIANLASLRENTIQYVTQWVNQLQAKIDKLSQRKANHYFSSKAHYEQVKDFLLSVSPLMDLRLQDHQVRQDEWRLKIRLGGQ
ncbi:hypothetical protein ACFQ22_05445 [Lentilactobacillus raoultii]|uniref:Uncharacterized protein n=1 Tax=Lentilactobacillus raoultii TaxID=1987503 RepID=A0ABW3PIT6_9LACO|nr:hypothetical protein [Lentilactobacillus raoultii]